jgi:hypothetical protein
MRERADDPCDRFLREWHFRRDMVQSYYRAMLLQEPASSPDEVARQRELRRELSAKLSLALLALRHASDQLQACEDEHEHEHAATHPPRV